MNFHGRQRSRPGTLVRGPRHEFEFPQKILCPFPPIFPVYGSDDCWGVRLPGPRGMRAAPARAGANRSGSVDETALSSGVPDRRMVTATK
jgi:hypothetical protein